MEVSVTERIALMNVLPKEGDITTLRILRDLQTGLGFSEEELEALKFVQAEGRVQWDPDGAEAVGLKEIEAGRATRRLIARTLKSLEKAKKLPIAFIDLYERFVKDGDGEESEDEDGG